MLLRECTDGVYEIKSSSDLRTFYPDTDFSRISVEFDRIVKSLNKVGVGVFLATKSGSLSDTEVFITRFPTTFFLIVLTCIDLMFL